jgi:hypothetical protein
MTKIIISLFVAVLILHGLAALTTYVAVVSGKYLESNYTTAELQISYGLTIGLVLTLVQGTALSVVPLMTYLGTAKYARSNFVHPSKKDWLMRLVKYFFFPLSFSVLLYLAAIAGADVTHDIAILLSNGKISSWSF